MKSRDAGSRNLRQCNERVEQQISLAIYAYIYTLYSGWITVEICAYIYDICHTKTTRCRKLTHFQFDANSIRLETRLGSTVHSVLQCVTVIVQLVGAERVCMLGVPLTDWRNEKRLWPKVSKSGLVSRSVATLNVFFDASCAVDVAVADSVVKWLLKFVAAALLRRWPQNC